MIVAADYPRLVARINSMRDASATRPEIEEGLRASIAAPSVALEGEVMRLRGEEPITDAAVAALIDGSVERYYDNRPTLKAAIGRELRRIADSGEPAASVPDGDPRAGPGVELRKRGPPPLPPYVAFPVGTLPVPISTFVRAAATAIGCDAAFVAMPLLAALAAAIGNSRRVQLKSSWSEPAILWCIAVAPSGSLKSPPFDAALAHLRRVQKQEMDNYKAAMLRYDSDQSRHESALVTWRKNRAGDPPVPPAKPTARRLLVADTTVEALARLHAENPRGLLLARDELSGWISDFDRYSKGGGDVAHWLEMHRAGYLLVDRKTGDRPAMSAEYAAINIAGTIQPSVLASALGSEHFADGLAARFLVAMPPVPPRVWTDNSIDTTVEAALERVFDELLDLQMNDGKPVEIGITHAGKEAWKAFFNQHGAEMARLTGDHAAAWSKLEAYCARFALVLHLARVASKDTGVGPLIDEHDIASAVTLVNWFKHETLRVYAVLAETEAETLRRELIELIRRAGGTITVRDLTHASRAFRDAGAAAERALSGLVELGLGEWVEKPTGPSGGRPTRAFRLRVVSPEPKLLSGPSEPSFAAPKPPLSPERVAGSGYGDAAGSAHEQESVAGTALARVSEHAGTLIFDVPEEPRA